MTLTAGTNGNSFLAKIDPVGNVLWVLGMTGNSGDEINGLGVDPSGNIYASGNFSGNTGFGPYLLISNSGSTDLFIMKVNNAGTVGWAKKLGGNSNDYSSALSYS